MTNLNLVMLQLLCRYGGLTVSELDSRLGSLGLSPSWGHPAGFLGKTLNSHSASLHPSTDEFNAGGNPAVGWHPIQGGVEILLQV